MLSVTAKPQHNTATRPYSSLPGIFLPLYSLGRPPKRLFSGRLSPNKWKYDLSINIKKKKLKSDKVWREESGHNSKKNSFKTAKMSKLHGEMCRIAVDWHINAKNKMSLHCEDGACKMYLFPLADHAQCPAHPLSPFFYPEKNKTPNKSTEQSVTYSTSHHPGFKPNNELFTHTPPQPTSKTSIPDPL